MANLDIILTPIEYFLMELEEYRFLVLAIVLAVAVTAGILIIKKKTKEEEET